MKIMFSVTRFSVLVWITACLILSLPLYSQVEVLPAIVPREDTLLKLPKAEVKQTIADTVLPTISNSGMGLLSYNKISIRDKEKECRQLTIISEIGFTEAELKILREQHRLMNKQYHETLQKMIRDQNMDLQLGEILKDFYITPPF